MENKILIENILLKMNYDLSRTLTENKEFINEQKTYYYDSNGYLKVLNGPYAIPQGGTSASKVYPNLKPGEYPNFKFSSVGTNSKPIPFEKPQIPQSDVLGPQGSFPKSLGVDKQSMEMKAAYAAIPEPKEYTKKLSKERYDEFISERKRISKLPPSLKWTEYNKKLSEAFQEFKNYDKNIDTYYSAQQHYDYSYEYLTALYYPEQWKKDNVKGPDTHDVLLLVAVGVFSIPLLLAAAGASAVVVGAATTGAMIVSTSADVADAVLYLEEGNLEMAGLSAIFALIPFVPNLARFGKGLIKTAVTKYSKGIKLTTEELKVIEELSKEETQKLLKEAAEKQAASKMTPEMTKAVNKVTVELENKITKKSILKSPTANFLGTLGAFYVVGQGYESAVNAFKKSQMNPFNIYQQLVQEKKILLGWDDLKWAFGSNGSKEDNEKLAAAMLAGYKGDEEGLIFVYKNPKFQTETWKTKWSKAAKIKMDEIRVEELMKKEAKTPEEQEKNDKELINIQISRLKTTNDGVEHTDEEINQNINDVLNSPEIKNILQNKK